MIYIDLFGDDFERLQVWKCVHVFQSDVNVIVVNWGNGARFPHYLQAAANCRVVGEQTRRLILTLVGLGTSLSDVHIIGHSLGAHIANYAAGGHGGLIDRITG